MSDLLKEAIADANKVKEIAYENAKAAIEEAFQPKIQRMISTKLAEEDFEDDEMSFEEEPAALSPTDLPATEPTGGEFPEEEEEEMFGESYVESGKNGTPDNPLKDFGHPQLGLDEEEAIDEEFERIIRELEAADDEFADSGEEVVEGKKKDAAYDQAAGKGKKNMKGTMKESEFADDAAQEPVAPEDDLEDLNLEALISKLEEEEFGQAPAQNPAEVSRLRTEVTRLRKQNREAFRVISELKNTMNEVNLLNSKLMYSSKILRAFDLSESQQVKVLETLDRAQSIREAKLIYTTIHEHYQGKIAKPVNKRVVRPVNESASRTIKTVKGNAATKNTLMEGASRWQQIAGIKPLDD